MERVTRNVVMVHECGGTKRGLVGVLELGARHARTSKVHVMWPLGGVLTFSALTGQEVGNPLGPWRLSGEDVAFFAAEVGMKPVRRKVPAKRKRAVKMNPPAEQLEMWRKE